MPSRLPLVVIPALIFAGVFLSVSVFPGEVGDFFVDIALPFLVVLWIGQGFNYAWDVARVSTFGAPPLVVAATGVLSALAILSMLGGIDTLWEDPEIFGVAVFPGLRMALPYARERLGDRQPKP